MSVEEKQARSVFVGSIPHGTTEEQMKEIFSTVGTVLSFRIVYDRETGNPKGYGFAEYSDIEMAQSAIRNLNGSEFNGRTLRVDKASSQTDELRMIHQQSGGPPVENPYGDSMLPEKAPEAISRAVASLPPEKMFELMKQMKLLIQNNMNEARTMLLNNPQLAYALLQAQVVMRIVEPQVAMALLHRKPEMIPPIMPSATNPIGIQPNMIRPLIGQQQPPPMIPSNAMTLMPPVLQPIPPPQMRMPPNIIQQPPPQNPIQQPMRNDQQIIDPRYQPRPNMQTQPPNIGMGMGPRPNVSTINTSAPPPTQPPLQQQQQQQQQQQATNQPPPQSQNGAGSGSSNASTSNQISRDDQEKAALIMQVLQLTEEQIAMLPMEQRQSILLLKEQIVHSAGGLI